MKKIIIFGISDFSEIVYYMFSNDSEYQVVGFALDKEYILASTFNGLPVIDFSNIEDIYYPKEYKVFVAIGPSKMNTNREKKYYEVKQKGYELVSYISSKATVFENVKIGDNCFILEDNTLQPFVEIGNNVVLWSGNHVGHHSVINDHTFITSHVVVSGRCKIGRNVFIGVNSSLRDNINIADKTLIGAGCTILKNTKEEDVFMEKNSELKKLKSSMLGGLI